MNKLSYFLVTFYFILLLILGFTTSSVSIIALGLLLVTGLIISISKINQITKTQNTTKVKICFSFIFSLLVFSSILFFWALGKNPLLDEFGFASITVAIIAGIGFVVSFVTGIALTISRKNITKDEFDIKPLISASTILMLVIIVLSFYNPSLSAVSQTLEDEHLCYLTLSVSNNSTLFNTGHRNNCLVEVAKEKLDVSICGKVSGSKTGCYIAVATEKNDPDVCKQGANKGIPGMDSCLSIVPEKTGIITQKDLVSAIRICEDTNECNGVANMEDIIFDILQNPESEKLIYAIKATKYMLKDGQRTRSVPLLRDLLTTSSLENRKASMDSLLYIINLMPFEYRKQELNHILPLIEKQSDLSNYTDQVKRGLSSQVLPSTQI